MKLLCRWSLVVGPSTCPSPAEASGRGMGLLGYEFLFSEVEAWG